jgi:hypothetical protein
MWRTRWAICDVHLEKSRSDLRQRSTVGLFIVSKWVDRLISFFPIAISSYIFYSRSNNSTLGCHQILSELGCRNHLWVFSVVISSDPAGSWWNTIEFQLEDPIEFQEEDPIGFQREGSECRFTTEMGSVRVFLEPNRPHLWSTARIPTIFLPDPYEIWSDRIGPYRIRLLDWLSWEVDELVSSQYPSANQTSAWFSIGWLTEASVDSPWKVIG